MDEIQKVLVKAGRKDLAQKYYLKIAAKLFYIGRRDNPQFSKPYYVAYGQLSKSDVKNKENSLYGSMSLQGYATEQEYNTEIERLKTDGFRVNIR